MNYPKSINICEVGPRDGLQNEKKILTADEKVELINLAIEAGYKVIEVGSLVHPKAIPALADTEEVFQKINKPEDVELRVLITNLKGVERAIKAGIKKVKLTVSASESHNMANFNRKTQETIDQFESCIELAKANGIDVSAAISTSFGCPFEGYISMETLVPIIDRFISLGLTEISLSDTTGMAHPKDVSEKCRFVLDHYPQIKWNMHFHNTRDLGLPNVLAAMNEGMVNFDASFSAIGGCPYAPGASGNLCSEDLIHMCENMGVETGIDLTKAIGIARRVGEMLGHGTDSYMLRAGRISDLTLEKPKSQNNN